MSAVNTIEQCPSMSCTTGMPWKARLGQNLRRGDDQLATDAPPRLRLATAFNELAPAV